jgi:hypothetical protein
MKSLYIMLLGLLIVLTMVGIEVASVAVATYSSRGWPGLSGLEAFLSGFQGVAILFMVVGLVIGIGGCLGGFITPSANGEKKTAQTGS